MPSVEQLWAETFRHAAEHSPYYRERYRNATEVPRLDSVPTVDKRIVSERNLDFLCVPREQVVEVVTTSGTTGKPLLWMLTDADLRRLGTNEKLSFECAGLAAEDTVLVATALDRCFMAGAAYWLGLRELGCATARVGPSSPAYVLEVMQRLGATAIVAVPSFLRLVADKAREAGLELQCGPVKKLICIGESIRDRSFALNAAGRAIQSAWGVEMYSTYGVTELANSLCECPAGQGGHLHEGQLYLEVLDEDGRPLPDGEIGEVVATTFGVEAMPIIRYRTGDCAALFRAPCPCGRTTPRLGPIVGRRNQRLKCKGVSVFPSALQAILDEAEGIEAFVIIATAGTGSSDEIEVLIHGNAPETVLREQLQASTRITPRVRHVSREEIETLQLPPHARKRRTFVDLR